LHPAVFVSSFEFRHSSLIRHSYFVIRGLAIGFLGALEGIGRLGKRIIWAICFFLDALRSGLIHFGSGFVETVLFSSRGEDDLGLVSSSNNPSRVGGFQFCTVDDQFGICFLSAGDVRRRRYYCLERTVDLGWHPAS
jgi:hypothetical protein